MNQYSFYSNEITSSELFDGLVSGGLFAEKMPSIFCSKKFLEHSKTLILPLTIKPTDYIRYSSMRNINIPRPLAIPEPFAYINQCHILSENWPKLQTHFRDKTKNENFKVSRIHLRKLKNKDYLFEMNYKNSFKDGYPEQDIVIRSKYIAIADISNCFPSIYSHSITWSLVGKNYSKKNRDESHWFNQLDFYTRNLKYGETNGVLIGPHSSNLISEIILTSVDLEMQKLGYQYVRNIDDYTCYVKSYEEAEKFFLNLSEQLKKYELVLNYKKSEIIPLPKASVQNWVTKLNHFNFTDIYQVKGKDTINTKVLKGFLDYSIELMLSEGSNVAILNYAIKIIAKWNLEKNSKTYLIKQIHHLVLLYPYLIQIIEDFVFEPHSVNKKTIQEIAEDIYDYGVSNNIFEACSYGIYWALKYDFKLENISIKEDSIKSLDCVFLIISYLYDRKHQRKIYLKEYVDLAKELKKDDFDRFWIYVYEVLPWDVLPINYKLMKKSELSFIKSDYQ
ncbi:hypothetical protein DNU06_07930 [Putridiphycobacter roseus]|uniref:Reverse transcriptase domain-containing protein n=1 Tax=Putridiphycobacter roseus TaxID=2219161 RepID=A0A2W1NDK5_9FLAO|nr:RNA-directed DNA polymerase [Putridiphycobacter roseus]PZE17193.1 hypothetical protein DNU06_07930 [Putridiphycobacter roseus]